MLRAKIFGAASPPSDDAFVLSGRDAAGGPEHPAAAAGGLRHRPRLAARGLPADEVVRRHTWTSWTPPPSGVLGRDLQRLLHAGDRRWAFPSRAEIADRDAGRPEGAAGAGAERRADRGDHRRRHHRRQGDRRRRRTPSAPCRQRPDPPPPGRRPCAELPGRGRQAGGADPQRPRRPGHRLHRLADRRLPLRHPQAARATRSWAR